MKIIVKDKKGNVKYEEEYDDNGNCIHAKYSNGLESWKKYNKSNQVIYCKTCLDSHCTEEWREYDRYGNEISYKRIDDNGKPLRFSKKYNKNGDRIDLGIVYKYDKNNNLIYKRDKVLHSEEHWTYNKNNKLVHYKNSYGTETFMTYDKNGNLIHSIFMKKINDNDFRDKEEWWEYNENNKCIHYINSDKKERIKEYDTDLSYYKNSHGSEEWYKYDKNGNRIYTKSKSKTGVSESWNKYDEKNRVIYKRCKTSKTDDEEFYEYIED